MSQIRSRNLEQEPDTIAIIPRHPGFMVIGTYSLISPKDGETNGDSSDIIDTKEGMLEILPSRSTFIHLQANEDTTMRPTKFPFGIYDIHFHPQHETLLGIATSDGEILFHLVYAPERLSSNGGDSLRTEHIGKVAIEERQPNLGKFAIITQLQFLEIPEQSLRDPSSKQVTVFLVATTQFGNTKLIRVVLQEGHETWIFREVVESQVIDIHKQAFELEAWTTLPIFTSPSTLYILSGGDDSQVLISSVEIPINDTSGLANLDLDLLVPTRQLTDRRTHEAGVVHICNLGLHPPRPRLSLASLKDATNTSQYLILTGSYDEKLRLFLFSPANPSQPTAKFTLQSEINLGGGVWRINILDTYHVCAHQGWDYTLLIAAHTAGACVVRLSCISADNGEWTYGFKVEKRFTDHDSMVYAVAANKAVDLGETWDGKTWDVISASFYDKKVCEWSWVDEKKGGGGLEEGSDHEGDE